MKPALPHPACAQLRPNTAPTLPCVLLCSFRSAAGAPPPHDCALVALAFRPSMRGNQLYTQMLGTWCSSRWDHLPFRWVQTHCSIPGIAGVVESYNFTRSPSPTGHIAPEGYPGACLPMGPTPDWWAACGHSPGQLLSAGSDPGGLKDTWHQRRRFLLAAELVGWC